MIYNAYKNIAFWRPGQPHRIKPVVTDFDPRQIEDVCFFKGVFYSIDHYDRVISFANPPRIVIDLLSKGLVDFYRGSDTHYIVPLGDDHQGSSPSSSSLLVVSRHVELEDDDDDGHCLYETTSFDLIEVNVESGTARRVGDIGSRALFVGQNSTFFVEASSSTSSSHGCRPNCIYFTDDNTELYNIYNTSRGGGADMGIYSLDENKVVDRVYEGPSQFSYETPALWVELPHH